MNTELFWWWIKLLLKLPNGLVLTLANPKVPFGWGDFSRDGKEGEKNRRKKMEGVIWLGVKRGRDFGGPRCFLPKPTKILSLQSWENTPPTHCVLTWFFFFMSFTSNTRKIYIIWWKKIILFYDYQKKLFLVLYNRGIDRKSVV